MSLQAFQHAIVELTLAPSMAEMLRAGDESVLAGYALTARERARLIAVAGQRGMAVHRTLARGNRLEVIFEAFPMTCVLLRPVLRAVVDELWAGHRPSHYQLAEEAQAFVDFVRRKMADGSLTVEYLADVFGYEYACRGLILAARHDPDAVQQTIVTFEHAPDQLLPPLSQRQGAARRIATHALSRRCKPAGWSVGLRGARPGLSLPTLTPSAAAIAENPRTAGSPRSRSARRGATPATPAARSSPACRP